MAQGWPVWDLPVESGPGEGIVIPPRFADCSGVRPSHYPLAVNVCDDVFDDPDPVPFSGRQLVLPPAP
jgi:hypothetical protein